MKITPQTALTGLAEDQRAAATELAPHLWNNPGTIFKVEDFPGEEIDRRVLASYLQAHCSANVVVHVSRQREDGSFTVIAAWAVDLPASNPLE